MVSFSDWCHVLILKVHIDDCKAMRLLKNETNNGCITYVINPSIYPGPQIDFCACVWEWTFEKLLSLRLPFPEESPVQNIYSPWSSMNKQNPGLPMHFNHLASTHHWPFLTSSLLTSWSSVGICFSTWLIWEVGASKTDLLEGSIVVYRYKTSNSIVRCWELNNLHLHAAYYIFGNFITPQQHINTLWLWIIRSPSPRLAP